MSALCDRAYKIRSSLAQASRAPPFWAAQQPVSRARPPQAARAARQAMALRWIGAWPEAGWNRAGEEESGRFAAQPVRSTAHADVVQGTPAQPTQAQAEESPDSSASGRSGQRCAHTRSAPPA